MNFEFMNYERTVGGVILNYELSSNEMRRRLTKNAELGNNHYIRRKVKG
jgi:hypothetical protein